jgi:hypothetical protein
MRVGDRSVERESLLCLLIMFLGGVTLQLFAVWPRNNGSASPSNQLERQRWLALWWPVAPTSVVSAWLCGWALSQPDPVPDSVGSFIFIASAPFALVAVRAVLRATWSLWRSSDDCGIATVGLLRPRIVFPPQLAKRLDEHAIEAALAHERAHVRHRDPLRIWVAQLVTDLQWPWGIAQRRFASWLTALELARDDEARATGVDGADLAAALIGSLRFQYSQHRNCAALIGQPEAVQARIARLLCPLPQPLPIRPSFQLSIAVPLVLALALAMVLGVACAERVIRPLLALSS